MPQGSTVGECLPGHVPVCLAPPVSSGTASCPQVPFVHWPCLCFVQTEEMKWDSTEVICPLPSVLSMEHAHGGQCQLLVVAAGPHFLFFLCGSGRLEQHVIFPRSPPASVYIHIPGKREPCHHAPSYPAVLLSSRLCFLLAAFPVEKWIHL